MPPAPIYSAASVVVMDATTGIILYSNEGDTVRYPASITKIMTALVVLEQVSDLTERVSFSERAIFSTPRTSSHISMDVGETLSIYQALYGLMLSSANEVSLALAEHVAGSIENFVELMNLRAASLGAHDTYFVNPSGLPGAGHVTTAYDMAVIMREAVRHPVLVEIMGTVRFDIPPTERQPETRHLLNTNAMIRQDPMFNPYVIGGKTGWTAAAGHTLVTYAQREDRRLIVSVLGGTSPGTFVDTTALLNFGFALEYQQVQIFEADANTPSVPIYQVENGTRTNIGRTTLRAANDLYYSLPPGFDLSQLRYVLHIPHAIEAPLTQGQNLGRMTIYVDNFRIGDIPLAAVDTVPVYTPATAPMPTQPPTVVEYIPAIPPPYIAEAIAPPLFDTATLLTLAIPLGISAITLIGSLLAYSLRRRRRARHSLHARYARYPHYRYR